MNSSADFCDQPEAAMSSLDQGDQQQLQQAHMQVTDEQACEQQPTKHSSEQLSTSDEQDDDDLPLLFRSSLPADFQNDPAIVALASFTEDYDERPVVKAPPLTTSSKKVRRAAASPYARPIKQNTPTKQPKTPISRRLWFGNA